MYYYPQHAQESRRTDDGHLHGAEVDEKSGQPARQEALDLCIRPRARSPARIPQKKRRQNPILRFFYCQNKIVSYIKEDFHEK